MQGRHCRRKLLRLSNLQQSQLHHLILKSMT
jgi:hypothetical protein